MKILVACEESQALTIELRKLGHEAWSCDLMDCSGGHPEWHMMTDVRNVLYWDWDMVIAFPPCTDLAVSGATWFEQKRKDGRQQRSIDFFMLFANLPCPRVAIENPVGIMSSKWRKPDQIIHPYMFGHTVKKATCLWLKGLPVLSPTHIVEPEITTLSTGARFSTWDYKISMNHKERAMLRSKTFLGIAKAMATQWTLPQ